MSSREKGLEWSGGLSGECYDSAKRPGGGKGSRINRNVVGAERPGGLPSKEKCSKLPRGC